MNGGLAMHGAGHAQPSLLSCEVEAVTPLTLSLARLGLAAPSPTSRQAQLDSQAACGSFLPPEQRSPSYSTAATSSSRLTEQVVTPGSLAAAGAQAAGGTGAGAYQLLGSC
ncbi:hypothetical protein V8C86DRAFT_3104403 [Haematococcus lacustris]